MTPPSVRLHTTLHTEPIKNLVPYARNSRTHSPEQIAQIAASLREFGFTNPVLIDEAGGIIAGHGRVLAAQSLGMAGVPCLRLTGLTDQQKRAYIIADNKLALNAGWDEAVLAAEIQALQGMDFDLDLLGFNVEDLTAMLDGVGQEAGQGEGLTDPDDVPAVRPDPVSRLGDVWLLGSHRLMCGDSAKPADVALLMAGHKASMMVTDPPYGVSYVGKTKDALTVENDSVDSATLKIMCAQWFDNANTALQDGAYVLATVPAGPLHLIFASDWLDRGWLRQIMVWNKDCMVLGHSEYHYKHEPILFGWKPGKRLVNSDRTKTTVWDFARPKRSTEHPTMKPIEMWCYAITQHSVQGGGAIRAVQWQWNHHPGSRANKSPLLRHGTQPAVCRCGRHPLAKLHWTASHARSHGPAVPRGTTSPMSPVQPPQRQPHHAGNRPRARAVLAHRPARQPQRSRHSGQRHLVALHPGPELSHRVSLARLLLAHLVQPLRGHRQAARPFNRPAKIGHLRSGQHGRVAQRIKPGNARHWLGQAHAVTLAAGQLNQQGIGRLRSHALHLVRGCHKSSLNLGVASVPFDNHRLVVGGNPVLGLGHHPGWHAGIQHRSIQVNDGLAIGMQNMGMHRRVLKPVNSDGEFACFVNGAHGVNYREKNSLLQDKTAEFCKKFATQATANNIATHATSTSATAIKHP